MHQVYSAKSVLCPRTALVGGESIVADGRLKILGHALALRVACTTTVLCNGVAVVGGELINGDGLTHTLCHALAGFLACTKMALCPSIALVGGESIAADGPLQVLRHALAKLVAFTKISLCRSIALVVTRCWCMMRPECILGIQKYPQEHLQGWFLMYKKMACNPFNVLVCLCVPMSMSVCLRQSVCLCPCFCLPNGEPAEHIPTRLTCSLSFLTRKAASVSYCAVIVAVALDLTGIKVAFASRTC